MALIILQRRHKNWDPTNGIPLETLQYKRRETWLLMFLYELYKLYDVDKTWIQMYGI